MTKKYLPTFRSRVMLVLRSLRIRALKREILRWFASPQQPYGDAWLAPVGKLKRESIRPRSLSSRRNKTRVNPTLNPRHVFESLEPRIVLAADLTFPPGASDLVLTYDTNSSQLLLAQTSDTDAIVSSAAWAASWTFVIFKVTSKFTPIRISERGEVIGLDLECHGEMLVSRAKVHSPRPFLFT